MGRRKNRSRSKISRLPPEVRSTVDAMVQSPAEFTYNDIREYLASLDVQISKSAIGNYARDLMASLEALAVSQESIKAMMETAAKVPEVDAVEIINRIAGQKIVQAIINKPDEEWTDVALDKLLREANAMTKAVAYKQRIDVQNKEDVAAAADELKAGVLQRPGRRASGPLPSAAQILDPAYQRRHGADGLVCAAGHDRDRA